MSLGVLNNLNAIYAENNLNNTSNSLNTVLQQLSSGSKINSGADDAAGLSLVDGLQANSQALAQSGTNAQEGVGLLQVADGALSQVTSLLNRAVTLATEASNGTLNSSQDTAANQEYQSILSEISNIGSTTTYNQEQVFNSNTAIYTGDSSTVGASVDDLNIRSLSSSNVGDTSGTMAYTSGAANSNVFIDLTNNQGAGTLAAKATDSLTTAGASITINTLSSSGTVVANTVSVGGTSGWADTAQGMINAINADGLGVTASFTTAAVAGATNASGVPVVAKADTGIMISGSVGVGANPATSSFSGIVGVSATDTTGADYLSGSITLQDGTGAAQTITTAQVAAANGQAPGTVSAANVAEYISADKALGVSAEVNVTTGDLTLTSGSNTSTTGLSSSGAVTANTNTLKVTSNLVDSSTTPASTQLSYTATAAYSEGISSATTVQDVGVAGGTYVQVAASNATAGSVGTGGTATISYTDKAGTTLSGTDLSTQGDAETALTTLNAAITAVAAQDGYIGAQINTLNSVSSVLSTQSENVTAAQNAVQATDYASATSNMSKYEILSQTGISALAQANSMQQEVTKLLQ